MTTSLFVGVYSVVPTRRRRFFWAAWWNAPPTAEPFQKPDAFEGGARSPAEAQAAASLAAHRNLIETDPHWAGAWLRVIRGLPPWPSPRENREAHVRASSAPAEGSRAWALGLLGLGSGATALEIRRGFRALALRTHPDRGGTEAAFIEARRALEVALASAARRSRTRGR